VILTIAVTASIPVAVAGGVAAAVPVFFAVVWALHAIVG
jgi:hypothetical protein